MGLFRKKTLQTDTSNIKHIAFIMDGNGRWAKARMLPRQAGHKAGVKAMVDTIENCASLKIDYVTFYAFSTENWNRPKDEIDALMGMFKEFLDNQADYCIKNNIRVKILGDETVLSKEIKNLVDAIMQKTVNNTGICVCIAFNYGSRSEIVRAAKLMKNLNDNEFTEEVFASKLYTDGVPDPDIIVRSAGDLRLSNFLLYQSAYSELFFTKCFWPDFNIKELKQIINDFNFRTRRFGKL